MYLTWNICIWSSRTDNNRIRITKNYLLKRRCSKKSIKETFILDWLALPDPLPMRPSFYKLSQKTKRNSVYLWQFALSVCADLHLKGGFFCDAEQPVTTRWLTQVAGERYDRVVLILAGLQSTISCILYVVPAIAKLF